jgi:putative ABC transport system permease protein
MGRAFTNEEDTPGNNQVAILSYAAWKTRFGGDANIIGATLDVDGAPFRVVGVMPEGFAFPKPDVSAWLPMGLDPTRRFGFMNSGIARLKPGSTPEGAERQTTTIMWNWARENGRDSSNPVDPASTHMKTIVRPLHEVFTGRSARPLTVLFGAVSLILLIATANVATLLSGRASSRQREINLRAALGASRARVVRLLLTESVVLALVGAIAGVALAYIAVRAFTHSNLAALPRVDEIVVDGSVLMFTLGVSVMSGLLFGMLPALHAGRARLSAALTSGQRESSRGGSRRVDSALVVAQLSLSVVLLIAAGLVLKSFQKITQLDPGFRAENVSAIMLPLPQRTSSSALAIKAFVDQTLSLARAIPGVQSASLTTALPMQDGANVDGFLIEGRPKPAGGAEDQSFQVAVSPDYFRTVGIPLTYGRDFAATDDSMSLNVAVVDATLANRYWKGAEAIGHRIKTTGNDPWFTIIGVVGTVREGDATLAPRPHIYFSIPQFGGNRLSLTLRTTGASSAITAAARDVVQQVDASIPRDDVKTLASIVDHTYATRRLTKILLGGFALIGLLLAAVGIYGVMSLHVANRRREFGIRLAVGADPRAVLGLVLREGAVLAGLGVVLGITGALALTRWISSLLYDVSPTDPTVLVGLPLGLAAIAIATCYLPARRAARSDPLATLRAD